MSQSTAAFASDTRYGHVPSHVPSHIPAHLVHDFEHYEDPLFRSNPFAVVERTRSQTPDVFFSPRLGGFWVVTSYELVREVYRNNELFSSRYIGVPAAEFPCVLMPLQLDPPAHMHYRNILNPMFAPRMVDQWEDGIRGICRSLISDFRDQRECEFVDAFASKLPNRVFVSLMGLPEDELPTFLAWEHDLLHGTDLATAGAAAESIKNYLSEHMQRRRSKPLGDDLIGKVLAARIGDQPLSEEDIASITFLLYIAGLDTVAAMTAFSFRHLAMHLEQQSFVRDNPDQISKAVEELLRLHGIVGSGRTVNRDMEFAGVVMKAGDRILCNAAFANADPSMFADGRGSDLQRQPNLHLTFGVGPHRCLGSHLARRELQVAMQELHAAIPEYRIDPQQPSFTRGGGVFGVESLHLIW